MDQTDLNLTDGKSTRLVSLAPSREYDVQITRKRLKMFLEELRNFSFPEESAFPLIPLTKDTAVEGRVYDIEEADSLVKAITLIVIKDSLKQQVVATIAYDGSTPSKMTLKVKE